MKRPLVLSPVEDPSGRSLAPAASNVDEPLLSRRTPVNAEQVDLREKRVIDAIPAFAARRGADMIVPGTISRPDRVFDLTGATAETEIRPVRCSLLTVPPTPSLVL